MRKVNGIVKCKMKELLEHFKYSYRLKCNHIFILGYIDLLYFFKSQN